MLLRAAVVTLSAAALLPLVGGTASASCRTDAEAGLVDGFYYDPKSQYWIVNYVHHSGTLNVAVQGDALVSDYTSYATADVPRWVTVVSGNAPEVTTEFVDCVAG